MEDRLKLENIPETVIPGEIRQRLLKMGVETALDTLCLLTYDPEKIPRIFSLTEQQLQTIAEKLKSFIQNIIGEDKLNREIAEWKEIDVSKFGFGLIGDEPSDKGAKNE